MLSPTVSSAPGGPSDAIKVKPLSVSSCACIVLSANAGSSFPYSPKVLMTSSPPKTSL